MLSEIFYLFVV